MICPHCRGETTSVIETRAADETIRRRRRCSTCRQRFWTVEATSSTEAGPTVYRHELRNAARLAKDLADTLSDLADL